MRDLTFRPVTVDVDGPAERSLKAPDPRGGHVADDDVVADVQERGELGRELVERAVSRHEHPRQHPVKRRVRDSCPGRVATEAGLPELSARDEAALSTGGLGDPPVTALGDPQCVTNRDARLRFAASVGLSSRYAPDRRDAPRFATKWGLRSARHTGIMRPSARGGPVCHTLVAGSERRVASAGAARYT